MKKHIIPYLLHDAEWWSGLNITNCGTGTATVSIEYHGNTGKILRTDKHALDGGSQKRFAVDIPYGWAIAITSDDVFISEFIGDNKSSMYVPVFVESVEL